MELPEIGATTHVKFCKGFGLAIEHGDSDRELLVAKGRAPPRLSLRGQARSA